MKWPILAILVAAASACTPTGVTRQPAAAQAVRRAHGPVYALDTVELSGVRPGQLQASREWLRANSANRDVAHDEAEELRARLVRNLSTAMRFDPAAPVRLRATLELQAPGYFEGLSAETSDLTLTADVFDANGEKVRHIVLRESASAPLQRSDSRQLRLEQAVDRLASRLIAEL